MIGLMSSLMSLMNPSLGILVGFLWPKFGTSLKPLGDGFIKLIKLLISQIIFCTVVHGIASMGDLKRLGRIGFKTLLYFEVVSTLALLIGLAVVNLLKPGAGFNIDPKTLDPAATSSYVEKAHSLSAADFFLNIIPKTFFDAFVSGDLLQVLFVAVLTACAIAGLRERGKPLLAVIEYGSGVFFCLFEIVVKAAPIWGFCAIGVTIGRYCLL